jgi:iron complex outermembrane receptor protein
MARFCAISRFFYIALLTFAIQAASPIFAGDEVQPTPGIGQPTPPASTPGGSAGNSGSLNLDMKLEDLAKQDVLVPGLSTPVTTAERQPSTIGHTPAAVFVITPEMIKRSGARTIPDVLRMAPGVDVARIDAHTWAISIRGFNERFANKLLVQIDGRVVYNGTFGGVYWNQQDVLLEDVERIEVVRGPQTVMWGSNAVNGVINIITKKASDTQGLLIQSGGGGQDQQDFTTVRYGGNNGQGLSWRVWGQQFDRASGWSDSGIDDAWHAQHGGFRLDYAPNSVDTLTIQGDLLNGVGGQRNIVPTVTPPFQAIDNAPEAFPTGNILLRYGQVFDPETSWQVLAYYDHYAQLQTSVFSEERSTYDIDLQYQFSPWCGHDFITGANYRNSTDATQGTFLASFNPANFDTQWGSVFAQDTITLEEDRWFFTLGIRLEENTFGGFQPEPAVRLLYTPDDRQSLWASISRAARNPNRTDTQISVNQHIGGPTDPTFLQVQGNPDFQPENLVAYEIGYRVTPTDNFTWDLAAFINDYSKISGLGPVGPPVVIPPGIVIFPVQTANNTSALTYGGELTANYRMSDHWRLYAAYSLLEVSSTVQNPGGGAFPSNELYLSSSWDLGGNVQFDLIGRYVDSFDIQTAGSPILIPSYFEMDTRIAWQATKHMDISFVGQNLCNEHHLEFIDGFSGIVSTEVRRSWYAVVTWRF